METEKKPLLQVVENKAKSEGFDGGERSFDSGTDKAGEERAERFDAPLPLAVQTTLLKERIAQRERELAQAREASRSEQLLRIDSEKELIRLQEQLKYQQIRADFEKANIARSLADKEAESQDLDRSLSILREESAKLRRQLSEVSTAGRIADEQLLSMHKIKEVVGAQQKILVEKEEELGAMNALMEAAQAAFEDEQKKYKLVCEQASLLRKRIDAVNTDLAKVQLEAQFEQGQRQVREQELAALQAELQEQVVEFARQRSEFEGTVVEKEGIVRAAQEELVAQQLQMAEERQFLTTLVAEKEAALAASAEAFITRSQELTTIQGELEQAQLQYQAINNQSELLQQQVDAMNAELTSVQAEVQSEQRLRFAREQELAALQAELQEQVVEFARQRSEFEGTVVEKEGIVRATQEELVAHQLQMAEERQSLTTLVAEKEAALAASAAEFIIRSQELAQIQGELEQAQLQCQALGDHAARLQQHNEETTGELARLLSLHAQSEEKNIALLAQQEQLLSEQEEWLELVVKTDAVVATLRAELAIAGAESLQSAARQVRLENDLVEINSAFEASQYRVFTLQSAVLAGQYLHEQLQQSLDAKRDEEQKKLLSFQQSLDREHELQSALQEDLIRLQEELQRKDEIHGLEAKKKNDQLSQIRAEWAEAQQKRDGHYRNLEAEQRKTRTLSARLDSVGTELEITQKKLAELRQMFDDRSAQVARLQRHQDALKVQLAIAKTRHEGWLSFQLGTAMIGATKSLKAAISLPFEMVKIISRHKREKKTKEKKNVETLEYCNRDSEKKVSIVFPGQPGTVSIENDAVSESNVLQLAPAVGIVPAVTAGGEGEIQCVELDQKFNSMLPFEKTVTPALKKLKVASILDGFTDACFAPECELVRIKPDNWRTALDGQDIDMLLVESAWNGNDGDWLYRVAKYNSPPGNELSDVIRWCKEKGIPTVFWNKEDPPNFDRFIERATEFDHIFTTDQNCIPRYRERCHEAKTIEVLMFAAQPSIHNPVLAGKRKDKTFFAGTYYADDFAERRDWMDLLLRSARRFGLDIFDRMYNAAPANKVRYLFPADLQANIVGCLTYEETLKAYREYQVSLNVNSVFDSPTMFSRRVFELLACGTPVVSTPSLGINNFFGNLVPLVDNAASADAALTKLMTDKDYWLRLSAKGVREIYERHTYTHRMHTICETIEIETAGSPENESLIVVVVRPTGDAKLFAHELKQQRKQPVIDIIIVGSTERDSAVVKHLSALKESGYRPMALPEDNISSYLNARHRHAVVTFCDSSCYYGPDYLRDAVYSVRYGAQDLATGIRSHFREENGRLVSDKAAIDDYGLVIQDVHPGSIAMTVASLWDSYSSRVSVPKRDYLNRYGFDFFSARVLTESQSQIVNLGD